jgi:4-amino-4-deoxy-L-arabinose transferase-like glycosyltransferase
MLPPMRARVGRLLERWWGLPSLERWLLVGAMATSVGLVLLYVLTTRSHPLSGDEPVYDEMARFWVDGKLWWSTLPFGEAGPSAWKAPLYPAFLGTVYAIFGESPLRAEIVQSLLAAVTVALTWALGRRLFGPTVAIAGAWIVALFPLVFEYYGILFAEALAIPLTVGALLIFLGRRPTRGIAIGAGAVIGLGLLARPTSVFLLVAMAASFIVATGWRRGAGLALLGAAIAALVVLPWTVRNYVEHDGLIPISVQDGAAYGTFNPETAADTENRWAWRAYLEDPPEVLADPPPGLTEAELRSELQEAAIDYIREHPSSVPKAIFWNGVVRFWDLRRPADAIAEADFQGRSRVVRGIGLGMYYVLLPIALFGLWRLRRRREIIVPVAAIVVSVAVLFLTIGGTRYRAPLEPLLALLAAAALPQSARLLDRDRGGPAGVRPRPPARPTP